MIKRECENLKALEIADNLRKDILEMCPDLLKVRVNCYPAFPATMEIFVETFCTDFINPDYLLGLEKRTVKKNSNKERPCFVTYTMADLLARIEQRVQHYGGIREEIARELETEAFYFIYRGPSLGEDDLRIGIKAAAQKAGMSAARFLKLWKRHSWKIKEEMREYGDTAMFPFWSW
jgi:hypothetical protein